MNYTARKHFITRKNNPLNIKVLPYRVLYRTFSTIEPFLLRVICPVKITSEFGTQHHYLHNHECEKFLSA